MENHLANQYPSWQNSRKRTLSYARRSPENTDLYRIVLHYHEQLELEWESRFQQKYGAFRDVVRESFYKYLDCGILKYGCARARCESCNHSILIAFSCKRRGVCPSCDTKRALLFSEHLVENILLPHSHRHVIFSLPKRLRIYFRYNRKLTKHLYKAAWEAWKEVVQEQIPDGNPGAVMALHSSGDLLNFHPHAHVLALNGAVLPSGEFRQLGDINPKLLEPLFANKVFQALLDEELITEEVVASMRSWEHSGFNVYPAPPTSPENKDALRFLAKYLKKSPIALDRLSLIEEGAKPIVRYAAKHCDDGTTIHRDFDPLEFLAELSLLIPNVWVMCRVLSGICLAEKTRSPQQ